MKVQLNKDSGEKLWGARKDTYNRDSVTSVTNFSEGYDFVKSVDFPKVNFKKEVKSGRCVNALAAFKAASDVIKTKPRVSWSVKSWNKKFRQLIRFLADIESEESNSEGGKVCRNVIERYALLSDTFPLLLEKVRLYIDLGYPHFMTAKKCEIMFYNMIEMDDGTVGGYEIRGVDGRCGSFARYKERIDAVEALKCCMADAVTVDRKVKKTLDFDLRQCSLTKSISITYSIPGVKRPFAIRVGFSSVDLAVKYLTDNLDLLTTEMTNLKLKSNSNKGYLLSESDQRKGKVWVKKLEITSDELRSLIDLRGLEYGVQMSEKDALKSNYLAYNGFMDLAEVLQLPVKTLGMGDLGLGLGSRGKGGRNAACAHFESLAFNINLTKKSGSGSFAHEWAHGLDSVIGAYSSTGKRSHRQVSSFYTEMGVHESKLPESISRAMDRVIQSIKHTKLKDRSDKLDELRSKAYWGTSVEMFARSFERWVAYQLELEDSYNGWLIRLDKSREGEEDFPYPTVMELEDGLSDSFKELAYSLSKNIEFLYGKKCIEKPPVLSVVPIEEDKLVRPIKSIYRSMNQKPTQLDLLAV
jgi:hypothetical protein